MEKTIIEPANGGVTCSNCRHARVLNSADMTSRTLCVRYPPTLFGGLLPRGPGHATAVSDVHQVTIGKPAETWCGEFTAKTH